MKTKAFRLVPNHVEVASVDASAMKGIHEFNICDYAQQFTQQHGYAGKLSYNIDMENYIIHVYTITMKELEQFYANNGGRTFLSINGKLYQLSKNGGGRVPPLIQQFKHLQT